MKNLIILSTILFYSFNLSAQGKTEPYWFSLGLGPSSSVTSPVNVSIRGNFSISKQKHLFSARYIYNEEFLVLGNNVPTLRNWDAGLLYGRYTRGKHGIASISSGIAITGGVQHGNLLYTDYSKWFSTTFFFEKKEFITIGLPIEGQLFWTPGPRFGIGLIGFANFNLKESFGGGLICLNFGVFDYP